MKAAVYTKYGPPEVLRIEEVETPVPAENEVLIRIQATAVTSGDSRMRRAEPFIARFFTGLFKPGKPILGVDLAGDIVSIGRDVTMFREGEAVFGTAGSRFGTYAEYITLPEDAVLAAKPDNITYEEAAATFFGGHTALHFLRKAHIQRGQKVLIYGASGCVGTYAVQLAKYLGGEVTGVCSTSNLDLVKTIGADRVIDYKKEDFTQNGVVYDVIFDTVGKSPFGGCIRSLSKQGIYLRTVHMTPAPLIRGLWVSLTTGKKVIGGVAIEKKEDLLFLRKLLVEGKLKPVIDRRYPLEEIAEAHSYVDRGHKKGNVVITVGDKAATKA